MLPLSIVAITSSETYYTMMYMLFQVDVISIESGDEGPVKEFDNQVRSELL